MKYYAVIDTNVLVSAMLKWDYVPGNIMEFCYDDISGDSADCKYLEVENH